MTWQPRLEAGMLPGSKNQSGLYLGWQLSRILTPQAASEAASENQVSKTLQFRLFFSLA
jgi:hypothetical protein